MNDEQLIYDLRLHAFDDCGENDLSTHICNIAADRLETMVERVLDLEASLKSLQDRIDTIHSAWQAASKMWCGITSPKRKH